MKVIGHPAVFILVYIVFMIPTYFFPLLGSNSYAVHVAGQASGAGQQPLFWVHTACLLVLIAITWCRGVVIDQKWLIVFPIMAMVFDLGPGINFIPLIPTVMHLLAMILGVALQPRVDIVAQPAAPGQRR